MNQEILAALDRVLAAATFPLNRIVAHQRDVATLLSALAARGIFREEDRCLKCGQVPGYHYPPWESQGCDHAAAVKAMEPVEDDEPCLWGVCFPGGLRPNIGWADKADAERQAARIRGSVIPLYKRRQP